MVINGMWTPEQETIIKAACEKRLLVDAGPGTGKTAVACGRIAYLINELGVEPVHIWLVSFTRTAVQELRNRITEYLKDKGLAAGICIATIDSHAWAIQSGFNKNAALSGSYDSNIENVTELIKTHQGVFEYLSSVRHLVVDEAQDIVGPRCELMLELIHTLNPAAGVTVLADDAQAIYGFADDDDDSWSEGTLPQAIRKHMAESFEESDLVDIKRTSDPILCKLFKDGRKIVREQGAGSGKLNQKRIREYITEHNHGSVKSYRDDIKTISESQENIFLLFRKRGEALEAAQWYQHPFRLRMSGLPTLIHDWIAKIFWDWTNSTIDENDFNNRWVQRVSAEKIGAGDAWKLLVKLVGISDRQISVEKLAFRLGSGNSPLELCLPSYGFSGPIIGTIHGAKGRETDEVRVYLPKERELDEDEKMAEEARVVFVAGTRARCSLKVGAGVSWPPVTKVNGSGRAFTQSWCGKKEAAANVEIGRQGDIDPEGLVGRKLFSDASEAMRSQEVIMSLKRGLTDAEAFICAGRKDYRYLVSTEQKTICYLSRHVNSDMFAIAKLADDAIHRRRTKPPSDFKYIKILGARTLAVNPDDPVREILHPPWRDSGFMVAPVLIGYSKVWFRY